MARLFFIFAIIFLSGCERNDSEYLHIYEPDNFAADNRLLDFPEDTSYMHIARVELLNNGSDSILLELNYRYISDEDSLLEWVDAVMRIPLPRR